MQRSGKHKEKEKKEEAHIVGLVQEPELLHAGLILLLVFAKGGLELVHLGVRSALVLGHVLSKHLCRNNNANKTY